MTTQDFDMFVKRFQPARYTIKGQVEKALAECDEPAGIERIVRDLSQKMGGLDDCEISFEGPDDMPTHIVAKRKGGDR